jgi:integrase
VTGLHIVSSRRKHGKRYYVYAWRGGPCIHQQDLQRPVITPELLDKAAAERLKHSNYRRAGTLDAVIDGYRASPEFKALGGSTQTDYRLWLDRASERFGKAPLAAFADPRMRGEIIAWRDRWQASPRTADKASGIMSIILGWAVDRGMITVNVAAKIRHLYQVNKADQIWESHHFRAMIGAPAVLRDAIRMAALTGLRLGDLITLDWSHVGPNAIILTTKKRKGLAVIPIVPALRHHLDRREWREGAVLRNSRGTAWTADGLKTAMQRARPEGFDRTFHDLRGTYITWLATRGFTDQEIARTVGWTTKRVAEIRARYVADARVVVSMIERLTA